MKTVQRERRYVCGQTKQNAVYQEIEIYTVGTDQKSRQREKQKVTPVPFRGKNPEHWDGHNAKRARKWFIRLLNTNFTEADTHTSLSNLNKKRYLWRFVHTRDDGRKLRITVTGKNTGAISMAFQPENETTVDSEITADTLDKDGTLVILDDELVTTQSEADGG